MLESKLYSRTHVELPTWHLKTGNCTAALCNFLCWRLKQQRRIRVLFNNSLHCTRWCIDINTHQCRYSYFQRYRWVSPKLLSVQFCPQDADDMHNVRRSMVECVYWEQKITNNVFLVLPPDSNFPSPGLHTTTKQYAWEVFPFFINQFRATWHSTELLICSLRLTDTEQRVIHNC